MVALCQRVRSIVHDGSDITPWKVSTEVKSSLGAEDVWLAKIEGEHPVFGFRRNFIDPHRMQPSASGEVELHFLLPDSGIYEVRSFRDRRVEPGTWSGYILVLDEGEVMMLPYDMVEAIAAVIETLRDAGKPPKVARRRRGERSASTEKHGCAEQPALL